MMNVLKFGPFRHDTTRNLFRNNATFSLYRLLIARGLKRIPSSSKLVKDEDNTIENMLGQLSAKIYQKNRIYKNDLLKIIDNVAVNQYSTIKQGLLLIRCCSALLPDEPAKSRMQLTKKVWDTLKPHTTFTVDHYNELLRCYIDNQHCVIARQFIEDMSPCKPNELTFQLLLAAVCEAGDMNQASEVISNMKSLKLPLTEVIFNCLIVGHGKCGQLDEIQATLQRMVSLNIKRSEDTQLSILRAYALIGRTDLMDDLFKESKEQNLQLSEQQIMDIVKTLATSGHEDYIPKVLSHLPPGVCKTPSISVLMQSVGTQLIHQGYAMAALYIYDCLPLPSFGPNDDIGLHGRSLLRECVKAAIPNDTTLFIAKHLRSTGRNPIAFEAVCEAALQYSNKNLALVAMNHMKEVGLPIRPHYFWPLLLQISKQFGEKAVFETISEMLALEVVPDYETLIDFVMPLVSFSSPDILVKKFQFVGLTATTVITPMLVVLLTSGQNRSAKALCQRYDVKVDMEKLIQPLVQSYLINQDINMILDILRIIAERTKDNKGKVIDWCGMYLYKLLTNSKVKYDIAAITTILKVFQKSKLKISKEFGSKCTLKVQNLSSNHDVNELLEILKSLVDPHKIHVEQGTSHILHPRDMDIDDLENHLRELEMKNMNTRGVLRKLLQSYCKQGDLKNAKRIVSKCEMDRIKLSSGMRAMVADMYIKLEDLISAEKILSDLKRDDPNFLLDEHKVIDIATLMMKTGNISRILEFIEQHSKGRRIYGGKGIDVNCWKLLDAVAKYGNASDTEKIFNQLNKLGYLEVTNRLLGPLIKSHIYKDNVEDAVTEFKRCAQKYKKTPLKHELMCLLVKGCEDAEDDNKREKYRKMLVEVSDVDSKIHGSGSSQVSLVAALAEMGLNGPLKKYLQNPKVFINNDILILRCERFATENKLDPILLIARCTQGLKQINHDEIYNTILKVYALNNDCDGAFSLFYTIEEIGDKPSEEFLSALFSLLKSNKRSIPGEWTSYFEANLKNSDQKYL